MAESHREEIAKLEALYAGNPGGRVFVHLAEAYRKAGEHERARRILDEGLGRHPDSASGYVVLGRVLGDMQLTAEAETAFRRVLELDGGNLIALRWLGDLARQSGRNTEATAHYRELLIRNPSNEEVRDLVEIMEREESGAPRPAPHAGATTSDFDEVDSTDDAFAAFDEIEAPAGIDGPTGESDDLTITPSLVPDASAPDVTPWSAAPGATGDAVESPVEFGVVELDGVTGADAPEGRSDDGQPAYDDYDAGSELIASTDDDMGVNLDDLRRDDEAEPLEIHLLDPSYEPSELEEEFEGELDVSDLSGSSLLEEADDYADDTFVADLSAAGRMEPEEDELPAVLDVTEAAAALTLLPEDPDTAAHAPPAASIDAPADEEDDMLPADTAFVLDAVDDDVAQPATFAEADEPIPDFVETAPYADASDAHAVFEPGGRVEAESEAEAPAAEAEYQADAPAAEAESEVEAPEAGAEYRSDVRPGPESGLVTETMAVLYRSQGFHDRAADVYRALLRARPGDERLTAKLREAEEAAGTAEQPAAAGDDDAGEVWLRGVGAAWTATADAPPDEATPYAWTGDADEGETGIPIGSYLNDLVSWKAGSGAWRQPGTADQDGDGAAPDWMEEPGGAESWTPDSEPPPYPDVPATETSWTAEPAPAAEAWNPAGDAGTGSPPASWDLPAETAPETVADVDDGAGEGWTPMDLLNDVPEAPASASASDSSVGVPESAPDEDSDDDDDLEMFRSWLQSLKK